MTGKHRALYFGCLGEHHGGHFLHSDGDETITLNPKETYPGFPWEIEYLDGRLLENGKMPDNPTGKVRWTCGGRPDLWFAFYWWDRTGDSRPGSNSGFYVRGFDIGEETEAFIYACAKWPEIVNRQKHTLRLIRRNP